MPEPWSDADACDLRDLCAHFGIATHFDDVWGKRREVAPADLIALLSEFDVRPDAGLTPRHAIDALRRATWAKALPPVAAIQASRLEWSVPVRLPAALHEVRWRLEEESGIRHEGVMKVHARPELTRAEIDSVPWCERELVFDVKLPVGYHHLRLDGLTGQTLIVSAPERCYRPEALQEGGRVFGAAVQLYSLRSSRNWGIGDFTDLGQLIEVMADRGASLIGLNPLHALFPHNPAHASPYSPSSRQYLNGLYIDVEAVDEYAECEEAQRLVRSPEFQARLAGLRATALIDHPGVAAAKFEVLELLFASFRARHLSEDGSARDASGREFLNFVAEGGASLSGHALFEALQARFHAEDPAVWGAPAWPPAFHDLAGEAVRGFALQNAERVQFHTYVQWAAEVQLERTSAKGRAFGLSVGLYLDLAVSVDRAGSDAWRAGDVFSANASVGAPPDVFSPKGQGWGLPPLRPDRLRESGYRFFIETLRANMRHAGALRIDHVMSLMRLFWIPAGKTPAEGAYVHYALDEMLSIVAVESHRARCLVIGEDLGTVADEVRLALSRFDVLSYRLLYFERRPDGGFKPPSEYPECALVAVSTHDLPPLAGWWSSEDIRQRFGLGIIPSAEAFEQQLVERTQDRERLILAAQREGLLSAEDATAIIGENPLSARAVEAIHAFLAKAPSAVMIVQLEDPLGVVDQINMPGTTEEQPNWRRKMPKDLNELSKHEGILNLTRALSLERPRKAAPTPAS
jgi:(1->4)-alpha-D-glucan 1-alpha-D-glucosylmutase